MKYGFVEGKNGFNCVSCGTHRRWTCLRHVIRQNENPPEGVRAGSREPSPRWKSNFLLGVYALVQRGLGEREAVRRIADAKVFPHYERQSSQRPSGHASRIARQRALWRKYQRLGAQSRGPDPIGRQLAIGVTDFEMFLAGLGLPAPSAAPSGDKPRARK
jgi:hypothetical protein